MAGSTTRLGLYKPGGGSTGLITPDEVVDVDKLNGNSDKIDASIGLIKATSTTRPSSPFDGQIVRESDTSRVIVWDQSASKWLPLGIGGLVPVAPSAVSGTGATASPNGIISFTGSTSVSVDGIFSTDFDNYLVLIDVSSASAASQIFARLRYASADDSAANYNTQFLYANGATTTAAQFKGANSWQLTAGGTSVGHGIEARLYGPAQPRLTKGIADSIDYDVSDVTIASRIVLGTKNAAAANGLTFFANTGTITGTAQVFAYSRG